VSAERHTQAQVASLPACDICGARARYDAKTWRGPWAFLCSQHFVEHGIGLGLGLGQRLVVRQREP